MNNAYFKSCAKDYYTKDGLIRQRDALIKEYNDRVYKQAYEADDAFHIALDKEYQRVQDFQTKILDA